MKKLVAVLLLAVFCLQPVLADYAPYSADEFPQWSVKLHRAETLMFGALPVTLAVTGLGYSVATSLGAPRFSTDPFTDSLAVFGIAGALALVVAVADYIIGEAER